MLGATHPPGGWSQTETGQHASVSRDESRAAGSASDLVLPTGTRPAAGLACWFQQPEGRSLQRDRGNRTSEAIQQVAEDRGGALL